MHLMACRHRARKFTEGGEQDRWGKSQEPSRKEDKWEQMHVTKLARLNIDHRADGKKPQNQAHWASSGWGVVGDPNFGGSVET